MIQCVLSSFCQQECVVIMTITTFVVLHISHQHTPWSGLSCFLVLEYRASTRLRTQKIPHHFRDLFLYRIVFERKYVIMGKHKNIFCVSEILGDRLKVGQWPLKPLIGVRSPVSQQNKIPERVALEFLILLGETGDRKPQQGGPRP